MTIQSPELDKYRLSPGGNSAQSTTQDLRLKAQNSTAFIWATIELGARCRCRSPLLPWTYRDARFDFGVSYLGYASTPLFCLLYTSQCTSRNTLGGSGRQCFPSLNPTSELCMSKASENNQVVCNERFLATPTPQLGASYSHMWGRQNSG